jgi:hypothetical protein
MHMSKSFQTTKALSFVFGATALIALATLVAPAAAQGVPAGLLRLDSSVQALNAEASVAEIQQPKVRNTYAHVRKHKTQQVQ